MELAYLYTKIRSEFGRHCQFKDEPAKLLQTVPVSDSYDEMYTRRNPNTMELDTTPHMSEHEANTERCILKNSSMRHIEGGWPKDVDFSEQTDVNRFRKKAEKDEDYKSSIQSLTPLIGRCMKQNNTIDIYEKYFEGNDADHSSEPPSAKGLAVFRDPNALKRTATSINWHPESTSKIAVSYSILNFQDPAFINSRMPVSSYIWDINNPNVPEMELVPPSPLCCLRYNPKSTDVLMGGSYNGLITYYDLRKPNSIAGQALPQATSLIENSHHDPVYDVFWISSKAGNQCCSCSTDGRLLWWDIKNLNEPFDSLELNTDPKADKETGRVLGGSSLEYNTEAGPTKYLVGTEQGLVLCVNLRSKKVVNGVLQNNGITAYDNGPGRHHGPIYSIQRNPIHFKFFLSVGDWTARIWVADDLKTPIMTTKYHSSYLTAGCWSPTRAGVFFVTRMDGVVDVWDYFYRQNEVAYSHKIGDCALSSIAVQGNTASGGRHVAVGDVNGTVSLLEVCPSLAESQPNEKQGIFNMLEREFNQEKNLTTREKEMKKAKLKEAESAQREAADKKDGKDDKMEDLLRKVDANFLAMIKEAEDDDHIAAEGK